MEQGGLAPDAAYEVSKLPEADQEAVAPRGLRRDEVRSLVREQKGAPARKQSSAGLGGPSPSVVTPATTETAVALLTEVLERLRDPWSGR